MRWRRTVANDVGAGAEGLAGASGDRPERDGARDVDTTGFQPTRLGRGAGAMLIAGVLALVIGAAMSIVHLPYALFLPGPITNTLGETSDGQPLVSVSGTQTFPTKGALDFTTVIVQGGPGNEVNGWRLLRGWLDPDVAVYDKDLVFPSGITDKQVEEQNQAEMVSSQQEAVAVALRSIGEDVPEHVIIAGVSDQAPSGDALAKGDEIVRVDGAKVTSSRDVVDAVESHAPGDEVKLVLLRDGERVPVTATTTESNGRTILGVLLRIEFDFPYDVSIDAGNVGGPSAGMMFALAVRDVLTPGAMTGGEDIAGTGTIADDGSVGAISGIQQKLIGAERGGADWFLAPSSNCDEVVGHVPDGLRVVRVSTYDEAVAAVSAIADGDAGSLPTCTAAVSP
jgi:PDZ domain-containing protein